MKKRINVTINKRLATAIEELAQEQHRSVSNMVELMLYEYGDSDHKCVVAIERFIDSLEHQGCDLSMFDLSEEITNACLDGETCGESLLFHAKENR